MVTGERRLDNGSCQKQEIRAGAAVHDSSPQENSWGKDGALNKERIICEFVRFTPVMNQCHDEECMVKFLDLVKVNRFRTRA